MEGRIRTRLSVAEGRRFGLTVGIAFLLIAGVTLWRDHLLISRVTTALGGSLVVGGLLVPTWMGPIERGWMAFSRVISKVTNPIFMGIIYFGVLTPTGLMRRAFGGSAMQHEASADQSYWKDKKDDRTGGLERQF